MATNFWSNFAKFFGHDGVEFQDGTRVIKIFVDPTVVAVEATQSSLALYNGFLYAKSDNGLSTNWAPQCPLQLLTDHINDPNGAHAALAISSVASGGMTATDVQSAINELDARVTANNTGLGTHVADTTIHFTEGSIDHTNIQNIGTNTHDQIDTHIGDATIHFTEGSIDHTNIQNVGTRTHDQIDTAIDTVVLDLGDHVAATSAVHGVTGDVVGTTDAQDLSSKAIIDPTRADVFKETKANLETYAATATDGQWVFATDEQIMYQIIDNKLSFSGANFVEKSIEIQARGNAGESIPNSSTDIAFIGTVDEEGAWDGTKFTVPLDAGGIYSVSGRCLFTSAGARSINAYINGVLDKQISDGVSQTGPHFSGRIKLSPGDELSFRIFGPSGTLNNSSTGHTLFITKEVENQKGVVFEGNSFAYVRQLIKENEASLEFELELDGVKVNGVDLITWNRDEKITEFKVFIRPLQGVNALHQKMGAMLESMKTN